jgi:hypothetical protein
LLTMSYEQPFGVTLEASSLPSKPTHDSEFFQPVKFQARMYGDLFNGKRQREIVLSQHESPVVTYDLASAVHLIRLPNGEISCGSMEFILQDPYTVKREKRVDESS